MRRIVTGSGLRRIGARFFGLSLALSVLTVVGSAPASFAHTPHDVITSIAASPSYAQDHTLLAISDDHVLRSTDAGAHWVESTRGLGAISHDAEATDTATVRAKTLGRFAFAPSDPRIVYLSSRGVGIYKSTDRGTTWTSTNTPRALANVSSVIVSPASPDVVIAAVGLFGGLYRTVDGGRTWNEFDRTVNVNAMTFLSGNPTRLVVADTKGAVFVSDDEGTTLRRTKYAAANGVVTALAAPTGADAPVVLAGTGAGNAFVSTDRGESWSRAGTIASRDRIQSLIASPNYSRDHIFWASAWHTGAYRSTDVGRTWTSLRQGLTTDEQADQIHSPQFGNFSYAVGADGPPTLYLGGYDGLFVWNDSAQRWSEIQTESEYIVGLAVSPDYESDGTVAVTTYVKGVFISRDHGSSFTPTDHGLGHEVSEGNKVLPIRRMHNIVFSPAYATDHTIFTATWDRFVKSTDGGRTWHQILVAKVPPAENLRQFVIAVSPDYARDGTIFLGTVQGVMYKSTARGDAGTWRAVSNVHARVRSLVVSHNFATDHAMFVSTEKGVFKSTDAGATWKQTGPSGISLLAISPDFARDGTLFAGTEHGLFVTRDKAATWTQVADGLPSNASVAALAVSPAFATDHTMLVSVAGTGLFQSTNGGQSFNPTGTELAARGIIITDFDRPTSEPIQFSPDFATDRTVYAYAQENLLRSTDGGTTWRVLSLPSATEFRQSWISEPSPTTASGSSSGKVLIAVAIAVVVAGLVGSFILGVPKRRSRQRTSTEPS